MKKLLGIFALFMAIFIFTAAFSDNFLGGYNLGNQLRWIGLYGIMSIGVAFVIITGGIDLSIGSVVGLVGVVLPYLLTVKGWSPAAALPTALAVAAVIGLAHGLLITKLRLQPFIVTLCGLLLYRGIARYITEDQTMGFGGSFEGLRSLAKGKPVELPISDGLPVGMPFLLMVGVAILAGILLNYTVWGRHLLALGRNEQAARFSGIRTDRLVIAAYIISALLAGVSGVLFALDLNSVQPSGFGNFYELYAIAAAVLGGCSLRGGEGSILGVVIGTAVLRLLNNAMTMVGVPTQLEFAVIGAVILIGAVVDELVKRFAARRRAAKHPG